MSAPATGDVGRVARRGARSSLATQLVVQLGSALATVLLARILSPADFGLVALVQSIVGVMSLVGLAGVTASIVTAKGDVATKAATYFWLAAVVGVVGGGLLVLLAPIIVAGLGQADATAHARVLALSPVLSLMTLVPLALMQRRLAFGRMNAVTVAGALVYFVIEVALALRGWGAWAVIWGQVAGSLVSLVVALVGAKWLPTARPRASEIRADVNILANQSASTILAYVWKNSDYWAVSTTLGPGPLGLYYVAYVLPNMVRLRITGVFRQVMMPVLAGMESGQQAPAWGKAVRHALALGVPIFFGMAAVADPTMRVFFGDRWASAVPAMQLVALAACTDLLVQSVSTLAIAQARYLGRATLLLGLRAVGTGTAAVVGATVWGSITAVAAGVLIAALLSLLVQEFLVSRPLGIGFRVLGADTVRYFVAAILMMVAVLAVVSGTAQLHAVAQLAISVFAGAVIFAGLARWLAAGMFVEVLQQLGKAVRGT